jgi:hypothetical protein
MVLPNEPKVVQCLPGKLKKQLCAKRTKTDTKPLKTYLKQHQTDTNDAKITPISPVLRSFAEEEPQNDTFYKSMDRYMGTTPAPGVTRRALASGGICLSDSISKLLSPDFCPQENIFSEERSQTLPVIIDDY